MRVMALDIGQVRVGVAISDPDEQVATPIAVLPASEVVANATPFRRLLEDWDPELFVCGLPYTMGRQEGPQAKGILHVFLSAGDAPVGAVPTGGSSGCDLL